VPHGLRPLAYEGGNEELALENFKSLCALRCIVMHFWHPKVILLEAPIHFIQNYRNFSFHWYLLHCVCNSIQLNCNNMNLM